MNKKIVKNSLEGIAQVHIDRIGKSITMAGPVFSAKKLKPNRYEVLDVCRHPGEVFIKTADGNELLAGLISYKLKNKEMAAPRWTRGIPDQEHITNINGKGSN